MTGAIVDPGTGAHLNLSSGFGYNSTGDKTSETNPNSNTTAYLYNSSRWRIQSTEPAPFSLETGYGYDLIGNQTSASRQTGGFPAGQATATSYSTLNKPLQIVDPLGHPTSFGYDVFGRRISTVDAENHVRRYILDGNGRLSQLIDANGVAEETRGLYPGGPVHTIADARGNTSTFFRDGIARLTQITYPDSTTEIWTLDAIGNVSSLQTRGGKTIGQTFDGCSRVLKRSPQGQPVVSYSYDFAGRLLTASTPVVSGDASSGSFSRAYDSAGRLISETDSQGAVIGYQLDGNGNVTRITYPSGYYVTRAYDQLDRVTKITLYTDTTPAATFTYDGLDRRLTNDGSFTYIYNTEGMLTQVQNASGSVVIANYFYDPFKRQVQKTVISPSSVTRYVYSGSQLMEEYNCSGGLPGVLIRRYVYASPGEAIFQVDGSGNVTYLLNDHQGSLIAQANTAGTVLNKYTYSPFGENTGIPGSVIGFTGQRFDSETGLYYYKARHYKPSIGRFLQPDPVGYGAGMNLYGYVHNDPVNRTDPDGTDERYHIDSVISHFHDQLGISDKDKKGAWQEWHNTTYTDGSSAGWHPAKLPADRAPIMSTIVPGIGAAYLQQLPKLDGEALKNFWEARIATTKEEQDDASRIGTLNELRKTLTADIVKETMAGKAGPQTDAEAALLAQVSNELVERKTRVMDHLKVDIDQSLM